MNKPKINKRLQELLLAIVTDNVTLTETLMQEVYRQYKITRDNLLNLIFQMYMEYGKEGFINIVAKDKKKVNDLINDTLAKEVKIIGMLELSKVNELLEQVYKDTYYKTSYILRNGIKKAEKLKLVKKEHIESVVKTKFHNEMYSDRIWKNKEQMITSLKKELNQVMTGKKNLDQVIANIKKEFNVSTYEASRLARTEMSRVQTQANEDIARAEGIEYQMYDATLDGKTCDKCRDLDGNVYHIDDPNKPIPPLHPFTRSHLLDLPNKEWRPTAKWDNENRKIINYKNYKEWYEQQVKEQPDFQIKEKMHKNKSNDKKQFKNYKEILGHEAPKSFDKFQELKYNNTKEWDLLQVFTNSKISGRIDREATLKQWKSIEKEVNNNIVCILTPNGIKISELSHHGIERFIGDGDKRKGVSVEGVRDALVNPLDIKDIKVDSLGRKSQKFVGERATISINPETGNIIQTNPTSSKLAERLKRRIENDKVR